MPCLVGIHGGLTFIKGSGRDMNLGERAGCRERLGGDEEGETMFRMQYMREKEKRKKLRNI